MFPLGAQAAQPIAPIIKYSAKRTIGQKGIRNI
jgi:hypothetical protein